MAGMQPWLTLFKSRFGQEVRLASEWQGDEPNILGWIPRRHHTAIETSSSSYDCTADINTALSSVGAGGYEIKFPKGQYKHTGNLPQAIPGTWFSGPGYQLAVLMNTHASNDSIIAGRVASGINGYNDYSIAPTGSLGIKGMSVTRSLDTSAGVGLHLRRVQSYKIGQGCAITEHHFNLHIEASINCEYYAPRLAGGVVYTAKPGGANINVDSMDLIDHATGNPVPIDASARGYTHEFIGGLIGGTNEFNLLLQSGDVTRFNQMYFGHCGTAHVKMKPSRSGSPLVNFQFLNGYLDSGLYTQNGIIGILIEIDAGGITGSPIQLSKVANSILAQLESAVKITGKNDVDLFQIQNVDVHNMEKDAFYIDSSGIRFQFDGGHVYDFGRYLAGSTAFKMLNFKSSRIRTDIVQDAQAAASLNNSKGITLAGTPNMEDTDITTEGVSTPYSSTAAVPLSSRQVTVKPTKGLATIVKPNEGMILNLDFLNNKAFVIDQDVPVLPSSLLTVTRASQKYVNNSSGVWTSISNNILALSDLGALIEDARTNIIRNNSAQGTVAGTPGTLPTNYALTGTGTLTRTVVGSGIDALGIEYADIQISGTASTNAMNITLDTLLTATNGQEYTNSVFLALVGGSLSNVPSIAVRIAVYAAGPTYLGEIAVPLSITSLLSTAVRYATTGTIAQPTVATIQPYIQIATNIGAAINFTIRIGWPQCELGGHASSPIRTTTVAVTRAADVVTKTSLGLGTLPYVMAAHATVLSSSTALISSLLTISDGTTSNFISLRRQNTPVLTVVNTASTLVNANIGGATAWAQNTRGGMAVVVAPTDEKASYNGVLDSNSYAVAVPAGMTQLNIGSLGNGTAQINAFVESVQLFSGRRFANNEFGGLSG